MEYQSAWVSFLDQEIQSTLGQFVAETRQINLRKVYILSPNTSIQDGCTPPYILVKDIFLFVNEGPNFSLCLHYNKAFHGFI